MKKYITLLLLLSVNIVFAQSEKYYVTFVKGQANLKKTNQPIKVGAVLLPTDAVVFKDQTAKVSCISPGKGRFDLSAQKVKASPGGELLAALKNNLVPSTTTYHLSTRSLNFDGYDPKTYFQSTATNDRILLVSGESLTILSSYKLDEQHFFFIQYNVNGTPTTKKIEHNEKGLIFNSNLFKDGIPSKVMLCYQSQVGGKAKSTAIIEFIPVLASKADLMNEVKVLKSNLGDNKKSIKEAVTAHLYDNYGKLGQEQIDYLLL